MSKEVMQIALDALNYAADEIWCENDDDIIADARTALRTALAQPEKEWVWLTDEEILDAWLTGADYDNCMHMLEIKLKEKNGY